MKQLAVRRLFLPSMEHKDSFLSLRDLVNALTFLRKIILHQQPQNLFHQDFFYCVIAPSRPEPLYWRGFTIKLINITLGVLGTSDQPVAETSTLIHTTFTRVRHPCSRRDSNLQSHRPTWPLALGFTIILLYVCVFLAGEEPGSAGGGTYSVSETTRGGCLSCFVRRSTVAVAIALLATRLYPSA